MSAKSSTYLELADALADGLADLPPGTRLPSEHELAANHDVSRTTARSALMELESRHLVRRTRGSGTYVSFRIPYPIRPGAAPSWSANVLAAGHEPAARLVSLESQRSTTEVARQLLIPKSKNVTRVERLRLVDDEVTAWQVSWLPSAAVPNLDAVLGEGSLTSTLVEHYDRSPVRWWSRAELATVPTDVAARLELTGRPPAWRIESVNRCAQTDEPIEFTQAWLRADAFRVFLETGPLDGPSPAGER